MQITGAQSIVEVLKSLDIGHIFGIPGSQNLELFDCLADSDIQNILVTNESSAVFMADGYSRATGKVGVCLSIPGPGLTNMFTGLAEGFLDSSPLLVLVGGFEESDKTFRIHEIKQLEAVKPIVKAVMKVNSGDEITETIRNAFCLAQQGEPGPVVVEVPCSLLKEKVALKKFDDGFMTFNQSHDEDPEKIKQIVNMVAEARLCGIYAGGGAFGASDQIRQLAELISAPVATTISGRGVVPEDHPLSVGFGLGPSGSEAARAIFRKCDTIIAIGCKFSEMATGKWGFNTPPKLIHIDKNKDVFNKNYKAKVSLCMDAMPALQKMLDLIKDMKQRKNQNIDLIKEICKRKERHPDKIKSKEDVHPAILFYELRKSLERDAILVTDCGNHQLWAISAFPVLKPRTFISPTDYQSMGFGIPAAIGAKLAFPKRRVVCISGDGGFRMSGFEILTAVKNKINLTIIVFNDSSLGLIKTLQQEIYGRTNSVDFLNPDYEFLAKAFGIEYIEIMHNKEIAAKLKASLLKEKTVLVNVKINYSNLPKYIKGVGITLWKRLPLQKKIKTIGRKILKNRC